MSQGVQLAIGLVSVIYAGILGYRMGCADERARIRARIITDHATSAADYSEAEDYADRMVQP